MTITLHTPEEHKAEAAAQLQMTYLDVLDARRKRDWDAVNRLERILPLLQIAAGFQAYQPRA